MGVGFPETAYLDSFAYMLKCAFGHDVYMVGSATNRDDKRGWHDVDLIMVIPDNEYKAMGFEFGTDNECSLRDKRWLAMSSAFSELGRKLTGLPIDFKFQSETHYKSDIYKDGKCNFLGGLEWEHQQERYRKVFEKEDSNEH